MTSEGGLRPPASRRGVLAWCSFDLANQGYPTVIVTFVFSAYFADAVASSPTIGTAQWGVTLSIAGLIIAVTSPVLGAIADQTGRRKHWLAAFTVVCILATAGLWFVRPDPSYVLLALVLVAVAEIGFEIGQVFYNSMLPSLVPRQWLGRVSGWAWALGYAGGLVALVLCLVLFVMGEPPLFGLDRDQAEHVRIVGPFVAAWFIAFAAPLFLFTPDRPPTGIRAGMAVRRGLASLLATFRNIRAHRDIARFLVARLFYIDGLNTLFAFGGIFAAGTFGMAVDEIILFGITLNLTAGIGAFVFGWVDDRIGSRRTILIGLACMIALAVPILLTGSKTVFWALALALGIFMGPVQAASRALMARLAPAELETEMFGLFALSGKVTAFVGPALVAGATWVSDSQRVGMSMILILLLVGAVIIWPVRDPSPHAGGEEPQPPA